MVRDLLKILLRVLVTVAVVLVAFSALILLLIGICTITTRQA